MSLSVLPSDCALWGVVLLALLLCLSLSKQRQWQMAGRRLLANPWALFSLAVLLTYLSLGLMDSVRITTASHPEPLTMLDYALYQGDDHDEITYSAPFAKKAWSQQFIWQAGRVQGIYPSLQHVHPLSKIQWIKHLGFDLFLAALIMGGVYFFIRFCFNSKRTGLYIFILSLFFLVSLVSISFDLSQYYHIFGTDKVGHDVFYAAIKSIRTGLIIGLVTSFIMLPFAIVLGMVAGYIGGWWDDLIQYVYTTLSSIPGVLLIAASILVLQIYLDGHLGEALSLSARADWRLLVLCVVLGITGWAGLCRLIRAESLKLREMDYVKAARIMGVSRGRILFRHIFPNVFHLIIITVVLDFSGLVLAEAVLSYVGVGVDPSSFSFGNMINSSRLELARDPVVWWPLAGALSMMFVLVMSANLFADAMRDAIDPRTQGAQHD
jgi:peptide/nickel transport system permease protein